MAIIARDRLSTPMQLTDEQLAIIRAPTCHSLITAVAGSGKTTTLAHRIRHLLQQGADPRRLLILMFNRSARDDFARKLREVTSDTGPGLPDVRTFHSMGYRLYQRFVQDGHLPPVQRDILTDQEIHYQLWVLIRELAPEDLQQDIKRSKKEFVETAANFVDLVKSCLTPAAQLFEEQNYSARYRFLLDLFDRFEQWRKQHRRISYADLLYEPVKLIEQKPELQRLVSNKMDVILVDEYQDINEIQHLLLKHVAGERARVTVVGDPDQTIYEFRGARPDFILHRFQQEFPDALEFDLSWSFRYGHRVALLANHLIHHNQGRKDILSHAHPANPDTEIQLHKSAEEADAIVDIIRGKLANGQRASDIVILCRVWSQSVPIELTLLQYRLPYQIDHQKGALYTREVQAMTLLLELASDEFHTQPHEQRQQKLLSLLQFPHVGLKERQLQAICGQLAQLDRHWGNALEQLTLSDLHPVQQRKIRQAGRALNRVECASGNAREILLRYVQDAELYEGIRSLALTHEAGEERIETVRGFLRYLAHHPGSAADTLTLIRSLTEQAHQQRQSGIALTTIHRSKGLEWPVVIIPGLVDKYLPYTLRERDNLPALLESERRLLYVAMTRAIKSLQLFSCPDAQNRQLQDDRQPSRFLPEMAFPVAEALGSGLQNGGSDQPIQLPRSTTIAQRYAQSFDRAIEASAEADGAASESSGPVWQHSRLNHALLGEGSLMSEDLKSFKVKFDAGNELVFSKESAHLYFTPVAAENA